MKYKRFFPAVFSIFTFLAFICQVQADMHYVSLMGTNISPYTSWANAATDIQSAVDVASDGETVLVTNGTYTLTNQITITNGITLRSVNGPNSTFVNGNHATRCLLLSNANAVVEGFTISNGYDASYGGGALIHHGTLGNCLITKNNAVGAAGGIFIAYASSISDVLVTNCVISHNIADSVGGGIYMEQGCLRNCLIYGNSAWNNGGGVHVSYNSPNQLVMENCTITENEVTDASGQGGGIFIYCTNVYIRNTISYLNSGAYSNWYAWDYGDVTSSVTFSNCCTAPLTGSHIINNGGSIDSDPLFVDANSGNYRLSSVSPCINTGTNQAWMTGATDLDGNTRIVHVIVDMGAYEFQEATPPSAPTGVAASDGTYTDKVRITWNASSGASGYEIWRNSSDSTNTAGRVGNTTTLIYDDTPPLIETIYYYWVKATNSYGSSSFSSSDSGYRRAPIPGQVAFSTASYTVNENAGSVRLTVVRSGGSDGSASVNYATQDGTAKGGTDYTSSSGTLSWPDGDSAGKTISVPIINRSGKQDNRAFAVNLSNASGASLASPSSATVTIIDRSPTTPSGVTAGDGTYSDKVLVYWDTVSVATSYKVWRSKDSNVQNASVIGTCTVPVYLDTAVTSGITYYYWIQAVNEAGTSDLSAPDSGYCGSMAVPAIPAGVSASDGLYTDRISVTWQAVSGATQYGIWRATENNISAATMINETTGTNYNDTSSNQGICYYYWIRTRNANGCSGYGFPDSGWKCLSPPSKVSPSNGSYPYHIQVLWNAVANATWYEIWREEVPGENSNGGNLTKVAQTGDAFFNDYQTKSGVYYRYKVKACNNLCSGDFEHNTGHRQVAAASTLLPVLNDYDGDKLSDLALFNSSSGVLDVLCSVLGRQTFPLGERSQGVTGDYDGDRIADPVTYCPDSGMWLARLSTSGYSPIIRVNFSGDGNNPVAGDFDGDGLADMGVYNETNGVLSVMFSNDGAFDKRASCLIGGLGWRFISADFDGDGLADPTIYSESEGRATILFSGSEYISVSVAFGGPGKAMYAADFDGDKLADPVLYEEGVWTVLLSSAGYRAARISFGGLGYVPVIGDYDGDGKADPAVYRESDNKWMIMLSASGYSVITETFGNSGFRPVGM